jgi:hypothetical protein
MNPDLARMDIDKMLTEAGQEERRQRVAKIDRVNATERREDRATLRTQEAPKVKEAPVDEDTARLGL